MSTRNLNNRNPKNNPHLYTRDLILNLYSDQYPFPEDIDQGLAAFVDEPRPPLAHLPLSDIEKRLLNMVSINSEGNRRNNYANAKPKAPKPLPVGPPKKEKHAKDDLWDMPVTGSNFAGTSFVGFNPVSNPIAPVVSPKVVEPVRQLANKNSWSVLESDEISLNSSIPGAPTKGLEIDFNSFTRSAPIGVASSRLPDQGQFGSPGFHFEPPMWVYEDPSKKIQGPFTSEQMQGWYSEGYFPTTLPIKCVGDTMFISLVQFVEKFGSEQPFLDSLRDQEQLEREFYNQRHRSPGFNGNVFGANYNPLFSNNPVYAQNQPTFNQTGFNGRSDPSAFLNYMQQREEVVEEPVFQPVSTVKQKQVPSPKRSPSPKGVFTHEEDPIHEEEEENRETKKQTKKKSKAKVTKEDIDVEKEEKVDSPQKPATAPPAPWANLKADKNSAMNKILEVEQREREERIKREMRENEKRLLAEANRVNLAEKNAQEPSLIANSQWGAQSTAKPKKTLAQIMLEDEEARKNNQNMVGNVGKGYANIAAQNAQSSKRVPIVKGKAVIATGPVIKAIQNLNIDQDDEWNVVGKSKSPSVQSPPVITPTGPVSVAFTDKTKKIKGASQPFLAWCRNALSILSNRDFNVDDFLTILFSIDIKESSSIIYDALGGFQSFDARLFADEFVRHRRDEMAGISWKNPSLINFRKQEKLNDQAWTSVGSSRSSSQGNVSAPVVNPIVHENKFAAVVGKTKKKKSKK